MKSKILNLSYTLNGISSEVQNSKYLNILNNSSMLSVIPKSPNGATISLTASTDYPLSNITSSFSITKEARVNSVLSSGYYVSGIRVTLPTSYLSGQDTFNTIFVNINKLNKTYLNNFKSTLAYGPVEKYFYFVAFRLKSSIGTVAKLLEFKNDGLYIDGSLFTYEYPVNLSEGNILIDQALIEHLFSVSSLNTDDYVIDIGIKGNELTTSAIDMSISNIFIGNSFDFYVDENMEYNKNNLNEFVSAKRTGKSFIQKNDSLKSLKATFDLMTTEEALENLNDWFLANKDNPIVFFPFCDSQIVDISGTEKHHKKMNLEIGGLYYISKDLTLKNSKYDVYSFALELKEYK